MKNSISQITAFVWNSAKALLVFIVWISVCLWSSRRARVSLCKRAYTHGYARYAFRRERKQKEKAGMSGAFLATSKRSDPRRVTQRGITFSNYIWDPREACGESVLLFFSVSTLPPTSYCLSLRFTFLRDGDARFNKAPGMSCHVMHSIACEIYVNTAIRSGESVSPALFLPFART